MAGSHRYAERGCNSCTRDDHDERYDQCDMKVVREVAFTAMSDPNTVTPSTLPALAEGIERSGGDARPRSLHAAHD